jgi:membrane protein required for colicin V production
VNLFDLAASLILIVSAIVGFSRGAVLELVTLFAFTIAAALAVYLLPFTAPIARHSVHPAWAANAAAVVAAFLIAYIALRVLGSSVSKALRSQATLGTIDRAVGLGFGVVRALVILGVFYLIFTATPLGRPPVLVTSGKLYPVARVSGHALASVAPGEMKTLAGLGQMLKNRASDATSDTSTPVEQSGVPTWFPPPAPPSDAPTPDAPAPETNSSEPVASHRTLQVTTGAPTYAHHHRHHAQPSEPVE